MFNDRYTVVRNGQVVKGFHFMEDAAQCAISAAHEGNGAVQVLQGDKVLLEYVKNANGKVSVNVMFVSVSATFP